jgi:hypothetical protein
MFPLIDRWPMVKSYSMESRPVAAAASRSPSGAGGHVEQVRRALLRADVQP